MPWKTRSPIFGFANASHVDNADRLWKSQMADWREKAEKAKWLSCMKLLDYDGCCLPTTCGYQFVFRDAVIYDVRAYFAMDGLGLAVALEDGVGHHFMGSLFSHNTCLCVCTRRDNGMVSASNQDNNFLVVGWGTSGGRREFAEAAARAAAADGDGDGGGDQEDHE